MLERNKNMDKKFYTTTNWSPWLGLGIILSPILFRNIDTWWLKIVLLFLCFFPAIVVALTLRGYFLIEGNKIKLCYDRKQGRKTSFEIPLLQVHRVERIGKSVIIHYGADKTCSRRLKEADEFINRLKKFNPQVE